jgi:hypothetical protein
MTMEPHIHAYTHRHTYTHMHIQKRKGERANEYHYKTKPYHESGHGWQVAVSKDGPDEDKEPTTATQPLTKF